MTDKGMIAFINGNILTMEKDGAEAVIIREDKIEKTGPRGIVKGIKEAQIVDLKGRFLAPGFIDSHVHFVDTGLNLARVDLSKTRSLEDAFDITKERLEKEKKVTPLICVDFDESKWEENRLPKREELDKLGSNRAIIFRRVCGHIAVANKKALESIPKGWKKIDYNTGILLEDVVLYINEIFPPERKEIETAITKAQKKAYSLGITSIHDMTLKRYLDVYREMEEKDGLRIRVYAVLPVRDMDYITSWRGKWVKTGGIKLFADGSIGAKTAALKLPYPGTRTYGVLNYEREEIERIIREANRRGFQIFIHAIGERGIELVLNAYEKELGENSGRHRIEHFELADTSAIKRAKKFGVILAMQPNFIANWGKDGGLYENLLGEKGLHTNRFKTALKEGCTVCFGSDSMPPGPVYGIKGAMEHPTESISFYDAMRMYTINSAYAGFDEEITGSIKEDKKADLVVLSGSPPDLKVDMTMANGEIVYNRL